VFLLNIESELIAAMTLHLWGWLRISDNALAYRNLVISETKRRLEGEPEERKYDLKPDMWLEAYLVKILCKSVSKVGSPLHIAEAIGDRVEETWTQRGPGECIRDFFPSNQSGSLRFISAVQFWVSCRYDASVAAALLA
jgi:hypothetical protein